jgi:hypothetical protein
MNRPEKWQTASLKAREYYLRNFTVDEVMARFEQVFMEAMKRQKEKSGN